MTVTQLRRMELKCLYKFYTITLAHEQSIVKAKEVVKQIRMSGVCLIIGFDNGVCGSVKFLVSLEESETNNE